MQTPLILMIDDSEHDLRLMGHALRAAQPEVDFIGVTTSAAALDRLRGGALPAFVLLDLDLGRESGLDVLQRLKADAGTCALPIVICTASADDHSITTAYRRQAAAVVAKPATLDGFLTLAAALVGFWLRTIVPPGSSRPAAQVA